MNDAYKRALANRTRLAATFSLRGYPSGLGRLRDDRSDQGQTYKAKNTVGNRIERMSGRKRSVRLVLASMGKPLDHHAGRPDSTGSCRTGGGAFYAIRWKENEKRRRRAPVN